MSKIAIIKADFNDGDYVTEIITINDEEETFIRKVSAEISKIGEYKENWLTSEYCHDKDIPPHIMYKDALTEDEILRFDEEFVPYGEHGVHTIKSIKIYEILSEEELVK